MDRGFKYGDGFFETIRVIEGEIPLLNFHISRAELSAKTMEMEWPEAWSVSFFEEQIQKLGPPHDTVIRLDFFRSGSGTYVPDSKSSNFSINMRPYQSVDSVFRLSGNWQDRVAKLPSVPVAVYEEQKKPIWEWSFIKSSSAAFYVCAGLWLKKQSIVEDLILLNSYGNLCEGLTSNIILKIEDRLICPSFDQGAIEGVFLSHLVTVQPLERAPLSVNLLKNADEIWLTNAVHGIRRAELVR